MSPPGSSEGALPADCVSAAESGLPPGARSRSFGVSADSFEGEAAGQGLKMQRDCYVLQWPRPLLAFCQRIENDCQRQYCAAVGGQGLGRQYWLDTARDGQFHATSFPSSFWLGRPFVALSQVLHSNFLKRIFRSYDGSVPARAARWTKKLCLTTLCHTGEYQMRALLKLYLEE